MSNIDQDVQLLKGYLNGDIQYHSSVKLQELLRKNPGLLELVKNLKTEDGLKLALDGYKSACESNISIDEDPAFQRILDRIRTHNNQRVIYPFWRKIAASLIITVLSATAFYSIRQHFVKQEVVNHADSGFKLDSKKAVLTISDGNRLELSPAHAGIITGEEFRYEGGSVLFEGEVIDQNVSLTLQTPRRGQYHVVLPDGTKVWLNASTKIEYPRTFNQSNREVELQGEAYFEVAKERDRPFIVRTKQERIEVLGTHFNVNAYVDDPLSSVALVEGEVKVSLPDNQFKLLKPGEKSVINRNRIQKQKFDVNEVLAWKNGEFMFNNTPIGDVMRELSKWYGVNYEIAEDVQQLTVWGTMSRKESLETNLENMQRILSSVTFKVVEGRVIVMK